MSQPSTLIPWLTVLLAVGGVVVVTQFRQGPLVSPLSVTLLLLAAIFGVRPIMMVDHERYSFYGGNDVRNGFEIATWVGLVSVLFLLGGYFLGAVTRTRVPSRGDEFEPNWRPPRVSIARAASFSVLLLLAWLLLMVAFGGGFDYISLLFAGRSDAAESRLSGMPAIVPALPVVAALFLALTRIQLERVRTITSPEKLQYWAVVVLSVIPPSALGSRRFLIPSVLAALLGAVAPVWRRVISVRMVALAFVGFVALTIIPFVRSSGSRTGRTDLLGAMGDYFGTQGLGGTLENFFLSYDTEMFNYIAFLATRLGTTIEYGWGRGTVGELLLSPIPASIAPTTLWSNQILIEAFGGGCGVVYCPVPSVSGVLFYDGGFAGVVAGMSVLGFLMSRFEQAFLRAEGIKLAALLTLGAFSVQLVRGNTISQLWIAAQIVIVLTVLEWVAYRTSPSSRTSRPRSKHSQRSML